MGKLRPFCNRAASAFTSSNKISGGLDFKQIKSTGPIPNQGCNTKYPRLKKCSVAIVSHTAPMRRFSLMLPVEFLFGGVIFKLFDFFAKLINLMGLRRVYDDAH